MSALKKVFRSYVFDALILIALGVVILVWPDESLRALCICIGVVLGLVGLFKIIAFAADKSSERSPLDVLFGLFQIVLGAAFIIKSDFFIGAFQIITGVILLYGSILMFIQAIRLRAIRGPMFVLSLIFAVLTLLLAVVILVNPIEFAAFMTQLHGISLIIEGAAMLIVLHRVKTDVKAEE
ncbi:MAG: DUF308 domain-containing protein [Oscillospiraceae bacterium]|nr:DUF308 domain-containing protein [Oscillospiraceae bacterium]